MKVCKIAGIASALLALGTLIPVYAQRDGQGDKREEKQDKPDRQDKGGRSQAQPQQQPRARQEQPQRAQQQPAQQRQEQQQRAQQQPTQQRQEQPQRAQQQPVQQRQDQPQRAQQQSTQQRQEQPQRAQQQPVQQRQEQARRQQQPERSRAQAQSWQQQRGWAPQGAWQARATFQQDRAQHWATDHRSWEQRGGYGGYYIPQDRFALYFGTQHFFRLRSRPVMYMGYPRFEYSGFSFLLVDPWPEYWSDNWYDTDDVYIDYDDGYYLYNRRSPEIRLAITLNL